MPHVAALFRHPVKGLTPQSCAELEVQSDGRIAGDRVLAFRFADATAPEQRDGLDYWPKAKGLALQDFPALAALRLEYDATARSLRIEHDGELVVEAGIDAAGRERLVAAMTAFTLESAEGARLRRPGRLPLVLVGDGVTPRFQDRPRGYISVHGRGSVAALAGVLGSEVDDRRFRSNVVIEGLDAWQELEWTGPVRIGDVEFEPQGPIVRCLATHANPDTGVRDLSVLTTLTRRLGQSDPTLGRLLLPAGAGGLIRLGDELTVG